jgi:hypothetical protein
MRNHLVEAVAERQRIRRGFGRAVAQLFGGGEQTIGEYVPNRICRQHIVQYRKLQRPT